MKTNSPRPRPAGYRSVGDAITLVAATTRLLLVPSDDVVADVPVPVAVVSGSDHRR